MFPALWEGSAGNITENRELGTWRIHNVRGASKIKVKNVNKKRTVTVRRLIIFLNISRRPLLICLQLFGT
jgi:hypothetical protein